MKLTITKILCWGLFAQGCSLAQEEKLVIEMFGRSVAPDSATGTDEPQFQTWRLLSVTITDSDGVEDLESFADEPLSFRIVNRPLIIYEKDLQAVVGKSVSRVQLEFAPEISGGTVSQSDLTTTLASGLVSLQEVFRVVKAQTRTLEVQVNWGQTITETGMEAPSVSLVMP